MAVHLRLQVQPGCVAASRRYLYVASPPSSLRHRSPLSKAASIPHTVAAAAVAAPAPAAPAQGPAQRVQELDPSSFYDFVSSSDGLCVVDYYTDWCGPCQLMHKEVEKLTATFKGKVRFAKLNCGKCEEFSTKQRIRSLPTFRLYHKGVCLDELKGAKPVQLRQMLAHYLFMISMSA